MDVYIRPEYAPDQVYGGGSTLAKFFGVITKISNHHGTITVRVTLAVAVPGEAPTPDSATLNFPPPFPNGMLCPG